MKYSKCSKQFSCVPCSLGWGFFFDLFITKSRLDYAICFVQSGNTSATHGNALPFPQFLRLYKAAGEISSEEFNGEFACVVKNANARKWKKKTKKAKSGGNSRLEWYPQGGKRKTGEIVWTLNYLPDIREVC